MVLRQPRAKLVLSLTPLIDVVFILLIFFMLASQFVDWRQITLMPQAQVSGAASEEQVSFLKLLNDGSFRLDGEAVRGLETAIYEMQSHGKDRTILFVSEDAVEIQAVIDVIEALTGAGLTKVQLSEAESRVIP